MMRILTTLIATIGLALALSTTANARDAFRIGINSSRYVLGGHTHHHQYNNFHRGNRAPAVRYCPPRSSRTIVYGAPFSYYAPPVVRYAPRVASRYFNNGNGHRRVHYRGHQNRHDRSRYDNKGNRRGQRR